MSRPESNFEEVVSEDISSEASRAEEARADEPRGVLVRRPKTTIYTVLLGISAAALAAGCLLLVLEIWQYGPLWTSPWKIPTNLR